MGLTADASGERLATTRDALEPLLARAGRGSLHHAGMANRALETSAEMNDTVHPTLARNLQTLENGTETAGDRTALIEPDLTPGPIDQRQVSVHRHRQKSTVRSTCGTCRTLMRLTWLRSTFRFCQHRRTGLLKLQLAKPLIGQTQRGSGIDSVAPGPHAPLAADFPRCQAPPRLPGADPVIHRSELGSLGCFGHFRPNGIEVDVHAASKDGRIIEECL